MIVGIRDALLPYHLHLVAEDLCIYLHIWVTPTVCWLSQLHACCVCDTLQTSREATNLILNQSVVEKLLPLN